MELDPQAEALTQLREAYENLRAMEEELSGYNDMVAGQRKAVEGIMAAYSLKSVTLPGMAAIYRTDPTPATPQLDVGEVKLLIKSLKVVDQDAYVQVSWVVEQFEGCTKMKGARKGGYTIRPIKEGEE